MTTSDKDHRPKAAIPSEAQFVVLGFAPPFPGGMEQHVFTDWYMDEAEHHAEKALIRKKLRDGLLTRVTITHRETRNIQVIT